MFQRLITGIQQPLILIFLLSSILLALIIVINYCRYLIKLKFNK